jgi:hypothetical protein
VAISPNKLRLLPSNVRLEAGPHPESDATAKQFAEFRNRFTLRYSGPLLRTCAIKLLLVRRL